MSGSGQLSWDFRIPGTHAFCVHGQDLFLDVRADAGLVLLQQLWLKLSLPVPRDGYIHLSIAGAQLLGTVLIPAVFRFFLLVVLFAVAECFAQFCFQTIFHELGNRLFEHFLDIRHAAHTTQL